MMIPTDYIIKFLFSFLKFRIFYPRLTITIQNLKSAIEYSLGAVAQLGERLVRNEEAVGSIPISSTSGHKSSRYAVAPQV